MHNGSGVLCRVVSMQLGHNTIHIVNICPLFARAMGGFFRPSFVIVVWGRCELPALPCTFLASYSMSGPAARSFGRLLAERAKAAGVAYGGGRPGGSGGSGGSGGPPNLGKIVGGSGAAIALVVGGLAINSALFNGMPAWRRSSGWKADAASPTQLMVDIALSSIPGSMVSRKRVSLHATSLLCI